jgi:hypothetical protein
MFSELVEIGPSCVTAVCPEEMHNVCVKVGEF